MFFGGKRDVSRELVIKSLGRFGTRGADAAVLFQDFGFVEWWKAIAVVLTGIFAFLALTQENKDKETGNLTKWGMISIFGIVISATGGLVAQIIGSSNQAIDEKKRTISGSSSATRSQCTPPNDGIEEAGAGISGSRPSSTK
jgi:hypothetical protein